MYIYIYIYIIFNSHHAQYESVFIRDETLNTAELQMITSNNV